jgi:hypothetical protein
MSLLIGLLVALVIVTLQKFKRINIPFLGWEWKFCDLF